MVMCITSCSVSQVAVFSKTFCPYCTKAKRALQSLLKPEDIFVMEVRRMMCWECALQLQRKRGCEVLWIAAVLSHIELEQWQTTQQCEQHSRRSQAALLSRACKSAASSLQALQTTHHTMQTPTSTSASYSARGFLTLSLLLHPLTYPQLDQRQGGPYGGQHSSRSQAAPLMCALQIPFTPDIVGFHKLPR